MPPPDPLSPADYLRGVATFLPKVDWAHHSNAGERAVGQALDAALDRRTQVYHNLRRLTALSNNQTLKEGETDFLILDPEAGMLLLEVKGGEWRFNANAHRWEHKPQGGKAWITRDCPFEQASKNLHAVKDELARSFGSKLGFAFASAVAFPHLRRTGGRPAGAAGQELLDAPDLSDPEATRKRVRELLRLRGGGGKSGGITAAAMKMIRDTLSPKLHLVPALDRATDEGERIFRALTEEQASIFKGMHSVPRVRVEGVAGSGKTMLAMSRAEAFAREGRSVALLCYTKGLAAALRAALDPDLAPRIRCTTFHDLAAKVVDAAGEAFNPPTGEAGATFWNEEVADLLDRCAHAWPERYDALVVDEAQDFRDLWWIALEALQTEPNGPLYAFLDVEQNVFETQVKVPGDLTRFTLQHNCRNTQRINAYLNDLTGHEVPSRIGMPEGTPVVERRTEEAEASAAAVEAQVRRWLDGGLEPRQIAILSQKVRHRTSLADRDAVAGVPLVGDVGDWTADAGVLHATVRGFKGLEADAVVLLDVRRRHPHYTDADHYVAASRAKHHLAVIHLDDL